MKVSHMLSQCLSDAAGEHYGPPVPDATIGGRGVKKEGTL